MVSHLHERAVHAARNYLKAESDLIEILQEMDQCRGYRELEFKSLFDYATQSLKLSEAVSYNLIVVARKAREVPQLQEMIRSQEITLSNARMIAPVLKPENQDKWLEETLEAMAELYLEREDPVRKAERFQSKCKATKPPSPRIQRKNTAGDTSSSIEIAQPSPAPGQARSEKNANPSPIRTRIPAILQHQINLRDQGRCAHVDANENRCDQRRWLDIHHIQPVSEGGGNEIDNLTTRCKGHHRLMHSNDFSPVAATYPAKSKDA